MDVNLTWEVKKIVEVSFDSNGGTGTMEGVTLFEGDSFTLPECMFTPPNVKEFGRWEVDGEKKEAGDEIIVNADTTVKALWREKPNVTDNNGKTGMTKTPDTGDSGFMGLWLSIIFLSAGGLLFVVRRKLKYDRG